MNTRFMALCYALAITITLYLAFLSLRDSSRLLETEKLARESRDAIDLLSDLAFDATDLHGTALGYQVSSDPVLELSHAKADASVQTAMALLLASPPKSSQPEDISQLSALLARERDVSSAMIKSHRDDVQHINAGLIAQSVLTLTAIRANIERVQSAERIRLELQRQLHTKARTWNSVIMGGGVIALVLILVIGILLFRERSRRQLVEADHNRFFNQAFDMLCIAGMDGYFKRINPAFSRVLGYSEDEILSRPLLMLVHEDDRDRTTHEIEVLSSGAESVELENRYLCKDGSWKWLLWNSRSDPQRQLIFAAARDITKRKALEQQLHENEEALARALAAEQKSLKEIESKASALERSNRELGEFAHVAAHDLQEPLRMVSSYCAMLGESYKGKLGADADEIIGLAVDGAKRMQVLISDLLVYARVDHGGTEFLPMSLMDAAEVACQNLQAAITACGGRVIFSDLPEITGHARQVTQLMQNLIGNALKYHGAEPPVIVITATSGDDHWQVSIRDNGIGIAPRHHERIFGMFKRLHTREQYEGTGIGLAICRKIVGLHGGKIWVESDVGQGSTFHFTIAMNLDSIAATTSPTSSVATVRG